MEDTVVMETLGQAMSPLEFWAQDMGEGFVLFVLARQGEDGLIGKARLVQTEGMTLERFGKLYEEMLRDYEAEHGPLA